jgi:cell division protein FtsA
MKYKNINPKDVIFSLDIGTRSVIGTVGVVRDKKFNVIGESYMEHHERAMIDGQIHDITLVAKAVKHVKDELEKELKFELKQVAIAAAGRFLRTTTAKVDIQIDGNKEIDKEVIRSLELTAVKDAEDNINGVAQGKLYCVGYSVKSYYLNGYVISNLTAHKGENIGVEVIATFLPRSVVDSLYAVMTKVGLEVVSLTLEPIAAIEAVIPQNLRLLNLALVDIGAGTSDIAISSKDSIAAYGMVPMAGDEVTEAIAQAFLVDFNAAEVIKRECSIKEEVTYTDVLGLENTISASEVMKVITPVVEKVSGEIAKAIIELNGGKAPNAIFLVGGGAHTPGLKELLAEKLNLASQRIAIKGREAVTDCVCENNDLGSIGVTVLGIALTAIKRLGNDFINVTLNGDIVSLFNSHIHNVMDVLMQAGINPKLLIGKNGKNIRFVLNERKRMAFGNLAQNARILINSIEASLESEVKEGDVIEVVYALDGKEATPKVYEFIQEVDNRSFFYDDIIYNLDPVCFANGNRIELNYSIKENDEIKILYPATIGEFKQYYLLETEKSECYFKDELIGNEYIINEGDRIYSGNKKELEVATTDTEEKGYEEISTPRDLNADKEIENHKELNNNRKIENNKEASNNKESVEDKDFSGSIDLTQNNNLIYNKDINQNIELKVVVNGDSVLLKGKKKYVFIDVFDSIKFDLTFAKGNLILNLNGAKAGYYDELKEGDIIKIAWE